MTDKDRYILLKNILALGQRYGDPDAGVLKAFMERVQDEMDELEVMLKLESGLTNERYDQSSE